MPKVVRRSNGLIGIRYELDEAGYGYAPSTHRTKATVDPPIDKPPRPCSRCGKTFQPTVRRRMLCEWCYTRGDFTDAGADE